MSAQSFALAPKIREADEHLLAHPAARSRIWECHPELSFRRMRGAPLAAKASVRGQAERIALVGERFPDLLVALTALPDGARHAGLADALDALACLDTALRVRAGSAEILGGEIDAEGQPMRMAI